MKNLEQLDHDLNAFKFQFDDKLLSEIRSSYNQEIYQQLKKTYNKYLLEGGLNFHKPFNSHTNGYYLVSYGKNPLLWFSNNNHDTYQIFKKFFDSLEIDETIKKLVNFNSRIILYSGFLVIGNRALVLSWHEDYQPKSNAYTLITPLYDLADDHGNLLYKDATNEVDTYKYRLGEAIFFGEGFAHTTEKYGQSNQLRILVSLTFGTDKLEYWPALKNTIGSQSNYYMLPCGHLSGSCKCLNNI